MSTTFSKTVHSNKVFVWIGLITALVLLIPLVATQFSTEVNWDSTDFIVMALLLFSTGSGFVLLARRLPENYWLIAALLFVMMFVYLWAELAVGIFTDWGS